MCKLTGSWRRIGKRIDGGGGVLLVLLVLLLEQRLALAGAKACTRVT